MIKMLSGKVALVTGSAKRLGKDIAIALAKNGAEVVIHYNESQRQAEETANGLQTYAVQAELRDPEQAKRIVSEINEKSGRLDILVNNVGNFIERDFEEISPEEWRFVIDTTLNSAFYMCQAVLPQMAERKYGRIVNIVDAQADTSHVLDGWLPYCIGKNGVLTLTKHLARKYGGQNVTVNTVSPGILDNSVVKPPIKGFPLGRYASTDDVSNAVVFLLRNNSSYISGTNIKVDGAWSC